MSSQEKELGRIQLTPKTSIVVVENEWKGVKLLQIRKYIVSEKYTGWTKDGIAIPIEFKTQLQAILSK